MPLTSGVIITLIWWPHAVYFDNKIFFYMKPTLVNLIFAGTLFFSKFFTKKTLIKIFFKNTLSLEDRRLEKT